MFCKNCGNQVPDGVGFCANCGAPVEVQGEAFAPMGQPMAPAPNPMFANFLGGIKGFFSPDLTKELGKAARSQTLEFILYIVLSVLSFALAMTIGLRSMMTSLLESMIGVMAAEMTNSLLNFGLVLVVSFFVGALTYAVVAFGTWLMVNQVFKKQVTIPAVFNMVGFASIPLSLVSILNIFVGLIYAPIALVLYIVGVILSCVLLYMGIQKLDKLGGSPFFAYAIVILAAAIVAFVAGAVLYKMVITLGVETMSGSAFGMYDLF